MEDYFLNIVNHDAADDEDDVLHIAGRTFHGKSLKLFKTTHKVRKMAIDIVTHQLFDNSILGLILLNAVFIALDDPQEPSDSNLKQVINAVDMVFLILFSAELVVKVVAMGFALGKHTYLHDPWNVVDFVIVVAGIVSTMFHGIAIFSIVRIVRVFRPLRSINRIAGMRRLVNTLFACLPLMLDVVMLFGLIFYLFSLVGVVMWHESLHHRCWLTDPLMSGGSRGPDPSDLQTIGENATGRWGRVCGNTSFIEIFHVDCPANTQCLPNAPAPYAYANFDHLGNAALVIFQSVTLDGWITHSYAIEDGWSPLASIFFVILTLFGAFFVANLVLAVVTDALSKYTMPSLTESALEKHVGAGSKESDDASNEEEDDDSVRLPVVKVDKYGARAANITVVKNNWQHFVHDISHQAVEGLKNIEEKRGMGRKRASTFCRRSSTDVSHLVPDSPVGLRPRSSSAVVKGDGRYVLQRHHSVTVLPPCDENELFPTTEEGWMEARNTMNSRYAARQARHATVASVLAIIAQQQVDKTTFTKPVLPSLIPKRRRESVMSGGMSCSSTVVTQTTVSEDDGGVGHKLRTFCRSRYFTHTITCIIIINALVMAVEHYDMPNGLEKGLETANMVITFIFLAETLLKIVAFGKQWPRDKFNLFDALVVIISLAELAFLDSNAVSLFRVFRMFRVLRFLKLARSWKVLQKIIDMISTSLSYMGYLILLILLFIFIFAVLGRSLFSGQTTNLVWCKSHSNETSCLTDATCEWRSMDNMTDPSCRSGSGWNKVDNTYRANFHNLAQAMIHVFQILTKDNWALLCFRLQKEINPAVVLYFIVILVMGSYLLFSMFIAILLVKLSENSEAAEKRREKRRKKRQGIVDDDASPLLSQGSPTFTQPQSPSDGNSPTFPVSPMEEQKISRSDVLLYQMEKQRERKERLAKRKKMKYGDRARERRDSMMSGAGSASTPVTRTRSNTTFRAFKKKLGDGVSDDGMSSCSHRTKDSKLEAGLKSAMKGTRAAGGQQVAVTTSRKAKVQDAVETVAADANLDAIDLLLLEAGVDECFAEDEEDSEEEWEELEGNSFFIFAPTNRIRLWFTNIVLGRFFEVTISYLIIANCAVIAINDNALQNDPDAINVARIIDWCFTAVFSLEIFCRSLVHGAIIGEHSYLQRHRWNKVDFAIVAVSLLAIPIEAQARATNAAHQVQVNTITRLAKAFRAFRPLRILVRTKRMKVVVGAFVNTIPAVFNVMAVAFVLYFIFGIAGVQMMQGAFRRCSDGSDRSRAECVGQWNATLLDQVYMNESELQDGYRMLNREWINPVGTSFDDLGSSWVTLLQVAALSGWMDIMYAAVDSNSVINERPVRDNRPVLALFFVAWIFAGAFFVMNIFTGVVVDHFSRQKLQLDGSIWLTNQQEQSLRVKKIIMNSHAKKKRALSHSSTALNKACYAVVTHPYFPRFILGCVLVNVLLMATIHDGMDDTFEKVQTWGNTAFTIIFTIEMLLEMGVNGPRYYLNFKWFRLDFFIVCVSWIELLIALLFTGGNAAATIQLLRLGRAFRLLRHFKGLRKLLMTLYYSIPAFYNITSLLLLMFFIFSVLGMALFEDVRTTDSEELYPVLLSDKANFRNFPRSMLTLYRVATMDSWVRVVAGCKVQEPYCSNSEGTCGSDLAASIFFSTFMLCVGFVMMNLFIAIILENFRESVLLPEDLTKKMEHVVMFREMWATYDPQGMQFIPANKFVPLLHQLMPPIGLVGRSQCDILPAVKQLDFPITWPEQEVLFVDAIDAIGETVFDIKLVDSVATRKYLKTTNRMQLYQFGWTIAHWYACSVIQTTWRSYRLGLRLTGAHVFEPPPEDELYATVAAAVRKRRRDNSRIRRKTPYPGEDAVVAKNEPVVKVKRDHVMIRKTSVNSTPGSFVSSYLSVHPECKKPVFSTPDLTKRSTPIDRNLLAPAPPDSPKRLLSTENLNLSLYNLQKLPTLPMLESQQNIQNATRLSLTTTESDESQVMEYKGSFTLYYVNKQDIIALHVAVLAAGVCCVAKINPLWSPKKLSVLQSSALASLGSPPLMTKGSFTSVTTLGSPLYGAGPYAAALPAPSLGTTVASPLLDRDKSILGQFPSGQFSTPSTSLGHFSSPSTSISLLPFARSVSSTTPALQPSPLHPSGGLGRTDPHDLLRRATSMRDPPRPPLPGSVNPLLSGNARNRVSPPKRKKSVLL